MDEATLLGSVVYVRYWDHVLYKNTPKPIEEPAERETIGWLTKDEKGLVCVETDRTLDKLPYSSGSGSGLVLLKSCIIEIRLSPIQNVSGWTLIPRNTNFRNAESALQTTKRKIQPK
ncbi:MAG: hypothetical protein IAX21_04210 [Candidatus Bathyarchaeota archaeon]|nr:MAG: hypothetical protein IAX21_04210 [Candidatus Bathyarchaeota archaeon]